MEPFNTITSLVTPLDRANVDTDQIVPKQFLKLVQRTGFGKYLFYDWRFDEAGMPKLNFVLNNQKYMGAQILLTRSNFGSGSSREHAVWALMDFGFRVVISPSFADIFYSNCFKNGFLAITLSEHEVDKLFKRVYDEEGYMLTIDLSSQIIRTSTREIIPFSIDPHRKKTLLEGLDDIDMALQLQERIRDYEKGMDPEMVPRA